jgi:hypothetical protein
VVEPEELKKICERIVKSGELGRSRTYAAILDYLADHAIAGTTPKEISIAMDVLGRESDFDVGKDSIVRVHIYHLRSKLNTYFARQGQQEKYRIEIPKGQYMLAITENNPVEVAAPVEATDAGAPGVTGKMLYRRNYTPWLALFAAVMVGANLMTRLDTPAAAPANPFADSVLWAPILDDKSPLLVLVGDYYIMGEEDSTGNVQRMVREFDINSASELAMKQSEGTANRYLNLDLGYAPTSVPKALADVLHVLDDGNRQVRVKMMSELTTNDLVGNHIVYLGLLSGLRGLTDLMFAASGLGLGMTYDELINIDDDTLYASSSGLSVGEASYRDYGMVSAFPSPSGMQFVLLAGMRDEGLVNLAEEVTLPDKLDVLEKAVALQQNDKPAFEALYEVLGFDNTNFDAKLVYDNKLDTDVLWETRLIGAP